MSKKEVEEKLWGGIKEMEGGDDQLKWFNLIEKDLVVDSFIGYARMLRHFKK